MKSEIPVPDAASMLGLSERTVYQYIHRGTLRPVRHGRSVFLTEAEIGRYKRERLDRRGNPTWVKRPRVKRTKANLRKGGAA